MSDTMHSGLALQELHMPFMITTATPEDSLTGEVDDFAYNKTADILYRKETGSGNTGWEIWRLAELYGDLKIYEADNDGNPELRIGSGDAEELHIQTVYDSGAQTLDYVLFETDVASGTADRGQYKFNVDGIDIFAIDDKGIEIYIDVNDANPTIDLGSSSAEALTITAFYVSGQKVLEYVEFKTTEAGSAADRGQFKFVVDGTGIMNITDSGLMPETAEAMDLGSASKELGDIYQGDDKKHYFGLDQDFSMEYDEDGNNHMIFAGTNINMSGKYFVNEQGQVNSSGVYYNLDGDGDYIELADNVNLDMNVNDFSINIKIRPFNVTDTGKRLISKTDGTTGFEIVINEDDLQVAILDNTNNVTLINLATAIFTAEVWSDITVAFDRDGNIQAYHNGLPVGTPISCTATATIANGSVLRIGTETGGTTNEFTGQIEKKLFWNRLVSAAEVLEYMNGSIPNKYQSGSQTPVYTSDWSADVDGWGSTRGAVVGNIDGIGTPSTDNTLRFTTDNTSGNHSANGPLNLTIGVQYKVYFDLFIPTGQSNIDGLLTGGAFTGGYDGISVASANWISVSFEAIATGTALNLFATDGGVASFEDAGGDDVFYVHNMIITPIGVVVELDRSTMTPTKWYDKSGNNLDGTITGMSLENKVGALTIVDAFELSANDGFALGKSGTAFSDLFLASGAVINFDVGDVTLTHSAGKLTFGGDGAVEIDFNNHEMTNVDIDSGAIDGAIIGAATPAAGTFTTVTGSGVLSIDDTTNSTGVTSGSIHTDGGLGVAMDLFVGGTVNLGAEEALTLSTNVVTVTQSFVTIDEQGSAVDDIDTINGGTIGDILILHMPDSDFAVTAKDGTGNLSLAGDFVMDNAADTLWLIRGASNWLELSRSNNG